MFQKLMENIKLFFFFLDFIILEGIAEKRKIGHPMPTHIYIRQTSLRAGRGVDLRPRFSSLYL